MLLPFRPSVRTWTAVLTLVALGLFGFSRGWADDEVFALDDKMMDALKALVLRPKADSLQAVRRSLAADSRYNPYSDDLDRLADLVESGCFRPALNVYARSLPNLVLSVRAHYLASEAATAVGQKEFAAHEIRMGVACLDGITAAGDGSESKPFPIVRLTDEIDVLKMKFNTRIDDQELVFRGDKPRDKILATDGNTYWFDVSMVFNHGVSEKGKSPTAAGGSGLSAPAGTPSPARKSNAGPAATTAMEKAGG